MQLIYYLGILLIVSSSFAVFRLRKEWLFEKKQKELILHATEVACHTENFKQAMYSYLNILCEEFDWPVGHVYRPSKVDFSQLDSTLIWFVKDYKKTEEFYEVCKNFPIHKGVDLPGKIFQSGNFYWVDHSQTYYHDLPRLNACNTKHLQSCFGIPIKYKEEVIAIFEFFDFKPRPFDPNQVKLAQVFSKQLGQIYSRRMASSATKAAELRFNLAMETAGIGVYEWNINADKIIWNDTMFRLFEIDKKTFDNTYLGTIKHILPEDAQKIDQHVKRAVFNKENFLENEIRIRTKNGLIRFLWAQARLDYNEKGHLSRLTGVCQDITQRRNAEKNAEIYLDKLTSINATLQKQNFEIQGFYQTASHELKTPLTAVNEFISIILDGIAGPLNEPQTEFLSIAKKNCSLMTLYINDLLDISRLDTGKMSINLQPTNFNDIVTQAIKSSHSLIVQKNISLSLNIPDDLPEIFADEQRILQVITNLLSNAIKFTDNYGTITIDASEDPALPDRIKISITDTGCGIPEKDIDNIFERLYQGKNAKNVSNAGLGLGLSICKQLVNLHGGEIFVESVVDQGSTFSFTLPIAVVPVEIN